MVHGLYFDWDILFTKSIGKIYYRRRREMKYILLVLFLFGCEIGYSLKIYIDGSNELHYNQPIVFGEDGNIMKYSIFNLLDGNPKTTLALNKKNITSMATNEYFRIVFKENIKIDQLVFYNGFQRDEERFKKNNRAKEIKVYVRVVSNIITKGNREGIYKSNTFTTNLILEDSWNKQVIPVGEVVGNTFIFHIFSTYPGTHYNDTCISEIEFWYKGEKYEIANLEEAKREYLRRYIEEMRKGSKGLYNSELSTLSEENYEKLMKAVGWEVEKDREKRTFVVEFAENGEIILEWAMKDSEDLRKHPRGVAGYWKIDENGSLWIKIGNNPWKKELLDYYMTFKGTDLEGLVLSDWDECGESCEGEE
ncbi:NADase-type glycan-binding domain-containing protein [Thermospira aquatica]|uniref:NAD glycohydrolase translocation F5/8 type C domain-containing protein n=1 Tax=Thermospira aquatica TaxID=2828656 RepID=A0AAX3BE30_9SPIR|nr:hypothetical protein [Thermospira aquatica]URA10589.1 hypothetical protein KDW03_01950 [Thermospira aquatica]